MGDWTDMRLNDVIVGRLLTESLLDLYVTTKATQITTTTNSSTSSSSSCYSSSRARIGNSSGLKVQSAQQDVSQ